jgi:hypothetical protein
MEHQQARPVPSTGVVRSKFHTKDKFNLKSPMVAFHPNLLQRSISFQMSIARESDHEQLTA